MAKAAPKRKAANGYKLAERLPEGEILEDAGKTKKWKLGPPIGQGGFGEIYAAQEVNSTGSNYPYVIKIEPHTNGPLFVEMHFYMRNSKPADIEEFKKEKRLKTFGMPLYLGSGSHEFKNQKYRFVVMEKFGTDLWKIFLKNEKAFPSETVFKLGIQILDVLEYIHQRGYVHADIKAANILMGVTKATANQAYLVDFGLATKFNTEEEFKPNPKKAHDGTIEYLSRDAHKGVQTRRGDLEILAYNLIQWLGCTLPWENNLKDPNEVHKIKEEYMDNVFKMIKACFGHKTPPGAIVDYLNYIKTLKFNTEPDYKKIRKIFLSGIKDAGGSEKDPLVFTVPKKTVQKRKGDRKDSVSPKRKVRKGKKIEKRTEEEIENNEEDNDEIQNDSNLQSDVDEDVINQNAEKVTQRKREGKKKGEDEIQNNDNNLQSDVEEDVITKNAEEVAPQKKGRKRKDEDEIQNNDSNLHSDVDEDVINQSAEEVAPQKRGRKKKGEEAPKKTMRQKKMDNSEEELTEKKKPLTKNKTEDSKSDSDGEQNGTTDPYEGYNDAMKEVMKRKLQNGKAKGRKAQKVPTVDDNMEGYTESMKELAVKKKLVNKKTVMSKKQAPATSVENDMPDMVRGGRLRARKNVCYNDFDSD